MDIALEEAYKARDKGEVPVGAVIVRGKEIIARAHNLVETLGDPTAHAELLAIRQAIEKKQNGKFLNDCDLYVTLEPCPMCTGAILLSRIRTLYLGATDPQSGCCGGREDLVSKPLCNHKLDIYYGIREDACTRLLQEFFEKIREK